MSLISFYTLANCFFTRRCTTFKAPRDLDTCMARFDHVSKGPWRRYMRLFVVILQRKNNEKLRVRSFWVRVWA